MAARVIWRGTASAPGTAPPRRTAAANRAARHSLCIAEAEAEDESFGLVVLMKADMCLRAHCHASAVTSLWAVWTAAATPSQLLLLRRPPCSSSSPAPDHLVLLFFTRGASSATCWWWRWGVGCHSSSNMSSLLCCTNTRAYITRILHTHTDTPHTQPSWSETERERERDTIAQFWPQSRTLLNSAHCLYMSRLDRGGPCFKNFSSPHTHTHTHTLSPSHAHSSTHTHTQKAKNRKEKLEADFDDCCCQFKL